MPVHTVPFYTQIFSDFIGFKTHHDYNVAQGAHG